MLIPPWRFAFIAALYNRNFRYLWLAFICSSFGERMEELVLGWLVLEMTNSAFLVGLISALRFLGAFLGSLTGVMADRIDRRRLNIANLIVMNLVVAALTALVIVHRLGTLQN